MSVVVPVSSYRISERQPPELPAGLQIYEATLLITGDGTGGVILANFRFNENSLADFQPYVSLAFAACSSAVAVNTGQAQIRLVAGQWEKTIGNFNGANASVLVGAIQLVEGATSVISVGTTNQHVYLGRAVAGDLATLEVGMQNVDTMTTEFHVSGIIADRPFVAQDYWRV